MSSDVPEPSPAQEHQSISAILNAAADLLEKPGAWIQGDWALTATGDDLYLGAGPDAAAVCWCAEGAIAAVAGSRFAEAHGALQEYMGIMSIPAWNDDPERKQEEVVAALRNAATQAEPSTGRLGHK